MPDLPDFRVSERARSFLFLLVQYVRTLLCVRKHHWGQQLPTVALLCDCFCFVLSSSPLAYAGFFRGAPNPLAHINTVERGRLRKLPQIIFRKICAIAKAGDGSVGSSVGKTTTAFAPLCAFPCLVVVQPSVRLTAHRSIPHSRSRRVV
jgi:hypothetical protein